MRFWPRLPSVTFACILLSLGLWSESLLANGIDIRQVSLQAGEESYELSADFAIDFPPALEEAVARGLTLYFVAEFELSRPRWYWFDERAARRTQTWRLSYHALTRQYRLGSGALLQNFSSLADALRVLSRLRGWSVVEPKDVRPGESYVAQLRLSLDLSQLPKPFQLNALANREWDLSSPRYSIGFVPGPTGSAPEAK